MLALRTILHPTDFSERAQYAFGLACGLARDYGARLILLHVAEPPPAVYGEGVVLPGIDELRASEQEELDRLAVPPDLANVERRLEDGSAIEEIIRVARETHADLIVLGTHGRTGLGRLLMGSVAEQVMRRAPCPVLTVKTPFPETAPAREAAAEPAKVPAVSSVAPA